MQAIIDAIARRELNAEIALVVSNRADAYILERARAHGIAHHFVEPRDADGKLKPREAYDREVIAALDGVDGGVDLVLMIGYMRIVSAAFVERFRGRLYNVHPSLLPDFAGGMDLDVHQAVLDSGAKFTGTNDTTNDTTRHDTTRRVDLHLGGLAGCTVHVVTEEVDAGPILVQKRCAIDATDNADTLKAKVQHLGTPPLYFF
jgi:formyltetrahydrofolate-dependent phosphoribosylglycinamide formyltransferase